MKIERSSAIQPAHLPWAARDVERLPFASRLAISLERARRWEFWPAWLYYIPIVFWILLLGLKHRSCTVFTAVNPGLSTGGLVGERKVEALDPLQSNAPHFVAHFELLREGPVLQRYEQAKAFVEKQGLPCVLKPDVGQRGRGVHVARSLEVVHEYLRMFDGEVLIQRHVEGEEFGVFIARRPGSGQVEILSLVNKVFPAVEGDGVRTLRQLILSHPRAHLVAVSLFHRWSGRLDDVVPAGESLALVEIGAHSRGSLFLDAGLRTSPALVDAMTRLTDAVPGYLFGRIDLRVPTAEHLQRGEGIQVLEMNGVSAESAHIYNPDTPLLEGYRAMFRQWALAFEIGAENAAAGAEVVRPMALLKRFREDLRLGKAWF